MKLVKEHINFERGIDPKKSMGIGRHSIEAIIKLTPVSAIRDPFILDKEHVYSMLNAYPTATVDIKVGKKHKVFQWGGDNVQYWRQDADNRWKKIEKMAWDMGAGVIKDSKGQIHPIEHIDETQHFERGLDPKDAMAIGDIKDRMRQKMLKAMKDLAAEWGIYKIDDLTVNTQIYIAFNFQGFRYIITHYPEDDNGAFGNIQVMQQSTGTNRKFNSVHNISDAIKCIKKWIFDYNDKEFNPNVKESINFERGLDPKDAMQVGEVQKRKNKADRAKLIAAMEDMYSKFGDPDDKIIIERDTPQQFNIYFNSLKHNTYSAELYFNPDERKPHTVRFIDAKDHVEPKWCATVDEVITKLEIFIIQHES